MATNRPAGVPIMAGSAHVAPARGAKGFIVKPFNSGTVLDRLGAVRAGRQQGRALPHYGATREAAEP